MAQIVAMGCLGVLYLFILVIAIISLEKKRFVTAIFAILAFASLVTFGHALPGNLASTEILTTQLNPEVPVRGYKWVGAKAWVLYKNGQVENIVLYEK